MKNNKMLQNALVACLCLASPNIGLYASSGDCTEIVSTDAGNIDFQFVQNINNDQIYHKINQFYSEDQIFELDDGSKWYTSKPDIVKGWERFDRLAITQNRATFSSYRYALVNLDLRLAVPISLVREPQPGLENSYFVKNVDTCRDVVTLNDNKQWVVHASDHGSLSRINEHDRIIIGANVSDTENQAPYILIDTSNGNYVRAALAK